jgi:hypothetical protein
MHLFWLRNVECLIYMVGILSWKHIFNEGFQSNSQEWKKAIDQKT